MSFVRRYINVTIGGPANVTLKGLRVSATIMYAGGWQMGSANLLIFGLTKDHLNALSTLGMRVTAYPNYTIKIEAGDDENGMSQVFEGFVTNAWADMQTAPGVVMHIDARESVNQVKPTGQDTSAISHDGEIPAEKLLQDLANLAGLKFENNGVNAMIRNHYAYGSIREQMQHVADMANAEMIVQNGTLAVWPKYGKRAGSGGGLQISKETGMVGIPGFTEGGVMVKKLFDRNINYGTTMTVKSEVVTVANREWTINRIDYILESVTPRGDWFAILYGTDPGLGAMTQ
jgi:hypothetical protein